MTHQKLRLTVSVPDLVGSPVEWTLLGRLELGTGRVAFMAARRGGVLVAFDYWCKSLRIADEQVAVFQSSALRQVMSASVDAFAEYIGGAL